MKLYQPTNEENNWTINGIQTIYNLPGKTMAKKPLYSWMHLNP